MTSKEKPWIILREQLIECDSIRIDELAQTKNWRRRHFNVRPFRVALRVAYWNRHRVFVADATATELVISPLSGANK